MQYRCDKTRKSQEEPLSKIANLATALFVAVLSAAAKVGVKHYFIEDESPTASQAIPKSLAYLQALK